MAARNLVALGTLVIAVILGAALVLGSGVEAQTPFIEQAIAGTSVRLDYAVVPLVSPPVGRDDAVRIARDFVGENASALSARLAYYDNVQRSRMLVWVVDAAGLNWRAVGGGLNTPPSARPNITRAGVLVSATDGHVELMFTFVPPKP